MKTQKGFLTTQEVVRVFQEKGIPIQNFIEAVKSGKIEPYWNDGNPIDFEDFEIVLSEIEKAKKEH